MTIEVICPSCGRTGRAPEAAIGRTVRCPGCSHQYRLAASDALPAVEDDSDDDDDDGGPAWTHTSNPRAAIAPAPAEGAYGLDEAAVAPPSRAVRPRPSTPGPAPAEAEAGRAGGIVLPMPALVGGGIGVAALAIVATWLLVGKARDPAAAGPVASTAEAAAPRAPEAPGDPPAAPPVDSAGARSPASIARLAAARAAQAPEPEPEPAAPPQAGMVSVVDAMQTEDVPAATATAARAAGAAEPVLAAAADDPPAPDLAPATAATATPPAGDSDAARAARAGAASVASRDEPAGKALSTAEIVEESEPSVALIKGKGSSGTGFLVGPGLIATNSHVIDDEFISDLEVRFVSAGEKLDGPLKAELLYEDPERDLAFLAVKTGLKPLRVARAYDFRKGEDITVIGNPGMGDGQVLENAISRGVMSTRTEIEGKKFYQLGIAINPGNSGGPVFDSFGRVIGVATLKSMKQEATGFSIPIEELQGALARLAKEGATDADRYRSKHRVRVAVKGLGSGGALMCLVIDLRRIDKVIKNDAIKELLGKLEPVAAELNRDVSPTLAAEANKVRGDAQLATTIKAKVGEIAENYAKIRAAYGSNKDVDDRQLRPWKQTHKRLLTELSAALKLDVPEGLMVAFDDHAPAQATTLAVGPQNLGSYNSRLRQRPSDIGPSRPSAGSSRGSSLRDRMKRGGSR